MRRIRLDFVSVVIITAVLASCASNTPNGTMQPVVVLPIATMPPLATESSTEIPPPSTTPTVTATLTPTVINISQTLAALDGTAASDGRQAVAIAITKVKIINDATGTAQASPAQSSATEISTTVSNTAFSSATPDKIQVILTSTAIFKTREFDKQAEYKHIDYREIRDFPKKHIGEKVIVKGTITIIGDNAFQMYFEGTADAVFVLLRNSLPQGIYRDSSVVVYGIVAGTVKEDRPVPRPLIQDAYLLIDGKLR